MHGDPGRFAQRRATGQRGRIQPGSECVTRLDHGHGKHRGSACGVYLEIGVEATSRASSGDSGIQGNVQLRLGEGKVKELEQAVLHEGMRRILRKRESISGMRIWEGITGIL